MEFGSRHPYLIEQSESVLTTWVNQYRSKRKAKDALQLLSISSNANSQLHGLCLEDLAQYSEAREIFETAGYTEDAIRCARRMGDFDKARELNGGKDLELDQYLAWISTVTSTLAQGSSTSIEMLKEEKRLIENLVDDYVPIMEDDPDYTFGSDPEPF